MRDEWAIRASWVLPVASPPIPDGVVVIREGIIQSVGTDDFGLAVHEYEQAVLVPAFINAHTHLEFSDLVQPLPSPDGSFSGWIDSVVTHRRTTGAAFTTEMGTDSCLPTPRPEWLGGRELIQGGTAFVGNISTPSPRRACSTANPTGWSGLDGIDFREVLGLRADQQMLKYQELIEWYVGQGRATWKTGVSPHAPYSLHQDTFLRVLQFAESKGLPVAMHLAESREEMQLLNKQDGPLRVLFDAWHVWDNTAIARGTRPLHYLQQLARVPRALIVHGNYLDHEEMEFLAVHREKLTVVHCPRTHAYLQHDRHPLRDLLAQGARVVIGTDSRASNPDLSMLQELRFLARVFPECPPRRILEMATCDAAQALGLTRQGAIVPGHAATLAIVEASDSPLDPYAFLVSESAQVCEVFACGQPILTREER